jgi:hypothetical protein
MATFNDLPVEIVLEIIRDSISYNECKPINGENAAWTDLSTYHRSIRHLAAENTGEDHTVPLSSVSIHATILSLRL